MKVTKEDLPQREVQLNIEVEEEDLAPYMDRAYQRVVQRVNVPGFRRGKAPRAVLERFVGHEALLDEAVDFMIPEVVEQAVEQEQVEQGGVPKVELVQTDPVVFKANVPLVPAVVLDAYRDIRVQPEPVVVTDDDVEHMLEHLRSELAPWEPAERPVALDDQVAMDVRAEVEGNEVIDQKDVVYLATEENPNPAPGFAQALVGIEPGQSKEFALTFPEDYQDPDMAGQDCLFQVTVHQVKEKSLPDLNDEFAKGVGPGYETLDGLKEKMHLDILAREEEEARRRYEEMVMDVLLTRTTVELSPLLVEHEADHLLREEQEALQRQQVGMEQYLQTVGRSAEEHMQEARSAATGRLTRAYALLKVAELEGLTATPEDVEEEMKSMLEQAGPQAEGVSGSLDTPDGRESLGRIVINRKVRDRLAEIAKGEQPSSTVPALQGLAEENSPGGTQDAGAA